MSYRRPVCVLALLSIVDVISLLLLLSQSSFEPVYNSIRLTGYPCPCAVYLMLPEIQPLSRGLMNTPCLNAHRRLTVRDGTTGPFIFCSTNQDRKAVGKREMKFFCNEDNRPSLRSIKDVCSRRGIGGHGSIGLCMARYINIEELAGQSVGMVHGGLQVKNIKTSSLWFIVS